MSYIHNFPHWCYLQRDTRRKVYFFRKLHMSTLNLILTSILTQIRTPTFTLNLFLTFIGFEVWPWPWTWPWTRPGVGSGLGSRFRFRFWPWLRPCPQPGTRLFVSNRPTLIRIRTPTLTMTVTRTRIRNRIRTGILSRIRTPTASSVPDPDAVQSGPSPGLRVQIGVRVGFRHGLRINAAFSGIVDRLVTHI